MTRGVKNHVDQVTKFLETRALSMPVIDTDGKEKTVAVNAGLQPIQLWSYIFPENEKDAVLTGLQFDKPHRDRWSKGVKTQALIKSLRLALGAKPIPEFNTDKGKIFMPLDSLKHVSIIPIGVRYDNLKWDDPNGTIHEGI
jgi:hypothetical protein